MFLFPYVLFFYIFQNLLTSIFEMSIFQYSAKIKWFLEKLKFFTKFFLYFCTFFTSKNHACFFHFVMKYIFLYIY